MYLQIQTRICQLYIYPKGIFFINGQEKTENLIGRDKPLERRAHSGWGALGPSQHNCSIAGLHASQGP